MWAMYNYLSVDTTDIWKFLWAWVSFWQAQIFPSLSLTLPDSNYFSSFLYPRISSLKFPHLRRSFCGLSRKASLNCQGLGTASGVLLFEGSQVLIQYISGQKLTIIFPRFKVLSSSHSFRLSSLRSIIRPFHITYFTF